MLRVLLFDRWFMLRAALLLVVAAVLLMAPRPAHANTDAGALADCQSLIAQANNTGNGTFHCQKFLHNPVEYMLVGSFGAEWDCSLLSSTADCRVTQTTIDPSQTCSGRPEIVVATDVGTTYSNAGCIYAPYGDTAHNVCLMADGSQSYCSTLVHMRPTGDYTDPSPPANADPVPPPPKVCGGGSCYDPLSGQYCALGSSGQVCVTANSGSPGGCATSGDTTLCAGVLPPIPPKISVADPATSIVSNDNYADTTGYGSSSPITSVVTVNNYNTAGGSATSGASSGDIGPGSSDDGSDDGSNVSVSGGGDCGSPPIVSGDPAAQAIAYQAWSTRCAVEKQGQGLGTGQVGNLHNLYTPSTETVGSVVSDFQSSVQTTPIGSAVTGFFQVNGVGGSCPVWTVPASDYLPSMTFDFYCRPELSSLLDMARLVILIACAYAAFRIAFGDA